MLREDTDPHWTDIIGGVPAQLADGEHRLDRDQRRTPGGLVVAPPGELAAAGAGHPGRAAGRRSSAPTVTTCCSRRRTEPTEVGVWRYGPGGLTRSPPSPACTRATAAGGTTVLASRTLDSAGVRSTVARAGGGHGRGDRLARRGAQPAAARAAVPRGRAGRHPHRRAVPVLAPAGHEAAGADGPVRRPAMQRVRQDGERLPRLAVARRAGIRGRRGRRPGNAGPRPGLGPAIAGDFATARSRTRSRR